ncbi:hypothetical protein B0H15DRAFT_604319 [Mycena belliarum]|uniref:C-type lectin domain-containing protein n=1 Tax=Mycena belliarum TaxID=1033014 RepID=A0AAD6XJS0_9AGAR|nr:hypothetical protein B0H15DRAFT_604319 [Mycena belliae]
MGCAHHSRLNQVPRRDFDLESLVVTSLFMLSSLRHLYECSASGNIQHSVARRCTVEEEWINGAPLPQTREPMISCPKSCALEGYIDDDAIFAPTAVMLKALLSLAAPIVVAAACGLDQNFNPPVDLTSCPDSSLFSVWRPRAHFIAPEGWQNDPQGLYQRTDDSCAATSNDFVYWEDSSCFIVILATSYICTRSLQFCQCNGGSWEVSK